MRVIKTNLLLLLGVIFTFTGCGSGSHSDTVSDYMKCRVEMNDILKSCQDEASARAAVPKLQALAARLRSVATQAKKFSPTDEEKKAMSTKLQSDTTVKNDYVAEQQRLLAGGPEWPIIKSAVNDTKDAMFEAIRSLNN